MSNAIYENESGAARERADAPARAPEASGGEAGLAPDWLRASGHPRHPYGQLVLQHDHEVLVGVMNRMGVDLAGLDVLEVGCRNGERLRFLVELGADPRRLAGIDPAERKIRAAQRANPAICWIHDHGYEFPFPPNCFDWVIQSHVFSRIPDEEDRLDLARRMSRAVRPGGFILWIDRKRDAADGARGFSRAKVRDYFPDGKIVHTRSVRPRYFAPLHRHAAWLAKALYALARVACDARLVVVEMKP